MAGAPPGKAWRRGGLLGARTIWKPFTRIAGSWLWLLAVSRAVSWHLYRWLLHMVSLCGWVGLPSNMALDSKRKNRKRARQKCMAHLLSCLGTQRLSLSPYSIGQSITEICFGSRGRNICPLPLVNQPSSLLHVGRFSRSHSKSMWNGRNCWGYICKIESVTHMKQSSPQIWSVWWSHITNFKPSLRRIRRKLNNIGKTEISINKVWLKQVSTFSLHLQMSEQAHRQLSKMQSRNYEAIRKTY